MTELELWFGPRQPLCSAHLPKRCAWVSIHAEYVVIGYGLNKTKALRGEDAEAAKLALRNRNWQPRLMGTSKHGCPIYIH